MKRTTWIDISRHRGGKGCHTFNQRKNEGAGSKEKVKSKQ